eukprot:4973375-Amphidinium_carterae.1
MSALPQPAAGSSAPRRVQPVLACSSTKEVKISSAADWVADFVHETDKSGLRLILRLAEAHEHVTMKDLVLDANCNGDLVVQLRGHEPFKVQLPAGFQTLAVSAKWHSRTQTLQLLVPLATTA